MSSSGGRRAFCYCTASDQLCRPGRGVLVGDVREHDPQLRPLNPLALTDGQEIRLAILSEQEQVRSALADLLAPVNAEPADEMDEAALVATIC